jgi:hypothetical protein
MDANLKEFNMLIKIVSAYLDDTHIHLWQDPSYF